MSFAYKRAKAEHDGEPKTFTVDDETFTVKPKLGIKTAERFTRGMKGDEAALFESLQALFVTTEDYERFIDLDFDLEELLEICKGVFGLYAEPGESSASSESSSSTGTPSTPTSNGSTGSTSAPAGSVAAAPLAGLPA